MGAFEKWGNVPWLCGYAATSVDAYLLEEHNWTFLPNFVTIQFETTEPWVFLMGSPQDEEEEEAEQDD